MRIVATFAVMVAFSVVANLLLKTGAVIGREAGGSLVAQMMNLRIVAGLACFGVAGIVWAYALRTLPLNVALAFSAAQFVANILAAAFILSEPIDAVRWVGCAMIVGGILVVGWSSS